MAMTFESDEDLAHGCGIRKNSGTREILIAESEDLVLMGKYDQRSRKLIPISTLHDNSTTKVLLLESTRIP